MTLDPVDELLLSEAGLPGLAGSAGAPAATTLGYPTPPIEPDEASILVIDAPALANHLAATGRTVLAWCDDLRDERELGFAALERLDAATLAGVALVLLRLPKSLGMLQDYAERVAAWALPEVRLLAGAREKHLTRAMNEVLGASFNSVQASLGRRKARVLRAAGPMPGSLGWPRAAVVPEAAGMTVVSYAGAFAAGRLDGGTRLLLRALESSLSTPHSADPARSPASRPAPGSAAHPAAPAASDLLARAAGTATSAASATPARPATAASSPVAATAPPRAVDLGCGTGILSTWLAARGYQVLAIDVSWAACASTRDTAAANAAPVEVRRAESLTEAAAGPVDLVVCNPPFHRGTTKDSTPGFELLASAVPELAVGGEVWTVFNSHLPYLPFLRAEVGPTSVVARDRNYTVTRSRLARVRVRARTQPITAGVHCAESRW